ncbi:MAG: selenium-dependent molybdenum cofactor biosynthesis protein YqeB [Clostridium sp.]
MNSTVLIRGGGDIASGIGHRLHKSGFKVIMTEIVQPLVIRRTVSFADAIYNKRAIVEGVEAVRCESLEDVEKAFKNNQISVIIDGECEILNKVKVDVVIDAILAKKNIGTFRDMALIVIGIGPGFTAGINVDAVVETNRGHYLGKVIYEGSAAPNTGEPGNIGGYTYDRVIKSPAEGTIYHVKNIGDIVKRGEVIATIDNVNVTSNIDGVLRGLIREGTYVHKGLKIADTDPRAVEKYCFEISEKARAIGGGVLEAILCLSYRR